MEEEVSTAAWPLNTTIRHEYQSPFRLWRIPARGSFFGDVQNDCPSRICICACLGPPGTPGTRDDRKYSRTSTVIPFLEASPHLGFSFGRAVCPAANLKFGKANKNMQQNLQRSTCACERVQSRSLCSILALAVNSEVA